MVSIEYIIKLVGNKFDCEDITIATRKRPYPYYRAVAYVLCREFSHGKNSFHFIGTHFGLDHATVIHGINKFNLYKDQKWFKTFFDVYMDCYTQLKKEIRLLPEHNELKTAREVEINHRLKYIKLTEKSHRVINKLKTKLDNLNQRPIFKEIASLDDETLDLFEERAKAFLAMNNRK